MPSCQPFISALILENNTTNHPDLLSDNFKKNISSRASNNNKEKIRPADINNNKEDIKLVDIDKQRQPTPNWRFQNKLLNESSFTFREATFSESQFPTGTPVLDTQYEHLRSQNNNPFYPFNNQLDYTFGYYFAELETTKYNIDRFFTKLLMNLIT